RAVGMTRVQLRRMIRYEAGIIATYGGVLGLVVGTFFGWALVSALSDQGIDKFAVSIPQLVLCLVAAGLAGVLAAVWPARRAAKLDMLRAIAAT
ncbi:MAG: FtsX-like permease family protein, partial [Frankiaceae bacterium]